MAESRIALIGFGKIAKDAHVPAIEANDHFSLAAIVSSSLPDTIECPVFVTVEDMIDAMIDSLDAIAICTPPGPRYDLALRLIATGKPLLLEKPPTSTLGELDSLVLLARQTRTPILTAWHSQHAAGVNPARELLASEKVNRISMRWCEDVRVFHPGQDWIWAPDGFGVFDPGINGLSILSRILPEPLLVRNARLFIPENRQTPIAAEIEFHGENRHATMDWRGELDQQWSIKVETVSGKCVELSEGGARLVVDGISQNVPCPDEYGSIYQEFAAVVHNKESAIDREPLRVTADCFLIGERIEVERFD